MDTRLIICLLLTSVTVVHTQVNLTPTTRLLVEEDSPATLTCTYTYTGAVTLVTWYTVVGAVGGTDDVTKGKILPSECKSFGVTPDGDLYSYRCINVNTMTWTIKHANNTTAGYTWACGVASGNQGNVFSNSVYVGLRVPIQTVIMTQPSSDGTVDVNENTRQQFICETDAGRPIADIKWYKVDTGTPVEITSTINVSQKDVDDTGYGIRISTLRFYPTRTDNGYSIYCSAMNGENQDPVISTRKPTLNVRYGPDGPPTIRDVAGGMYRLTENTKGSLSCSSTGGNPLPELTWSCYTNGIINDDGTTSTTVYKTITWTAVRNSDRQCTCTSTHVVAESQSVSVNVEILYPVSKPTFTINSQPVNDQKIKVIEGKQLDVSCQSSGKPTPVYTWIQPDTTTQGQQLVIDDIQPSSDGQYTCRVKNNPYVSGGNIVSKESSVSVQVQFAPSTPTFYYNNKSGPKITQNPFNVIVGDTLQILGVSSGQPEPRYEWRHGTNQQTGELFVISSIRRDTASEIKCLATNVLEQTGSETKQSKTSTATVSMNILYPPDVPNIGFKYGDKHYIAVTDHTVDVLEGANFTLDCNASSNPPPTSYDWTGNGPGTSTEYHIGPITRNSARTFTCEVTNMMIRTYGSTSPQEGKNTANVTANVLFPPDILPMSKQSIEEGKPFTYTCPYTQGNPTETNVTWSRAGDGRKWTSATLEISNVSRSDSMMYTCTVQNKMEPSNRQPVIGSRSRHFLLDVKYMTSINQFYIEGYAGTTKVTVDEFTSPTFFCNVSSNPASDIAITFYNQTLGDKTESFILNHKAENVSCGNIGVYTCEGRNYLNTKAAATDNILLLVRCRPQAFGDARFEVYSAQYEATTITVSVIAYPEITSVVWKKLNGRNATKIRNGTRFYTSLEMVKSNETYINITRLSLTFQNVTKPDFGNYTVQINNTIGSIEKMLRLTPKDKPDQPGEFSATTPDSKSIRVQWRPGFDGGSEQRFVLMYKTQNGAEWTTMQIDDNGDETMEYILTGLEPDTEYELQLFAVNDVGNSSRISISIRTSAEGSGDTGKLIGGAAGGAGVGLLIIAALVGILVVRKRRMSKDKFGEDRALNGRPDASDDNTIEITENAAYVSADFAASSKSDACVYSQPTKKKAPVAAAGGDNLYAVVDKNKDKQDKPKKQQKGKEKGKDQGGAAQNDNIYANSPPVESPYEETQFDKQPTGKNVNKDGLIYADLAFNDRPNKGKKQIIIGDDDRTPYAQVDFTKRADPLPDSDQE